MRSSEEKCHNEWEVYIAFGNAAGGEIQMLATWVGGKQDPN